MNDTVNELFERYRWHARHYGGKDAKSDKSVCSRAATSVENAITKFAPTLSATERLSLQAAVTTLRHLSRNLKMVEKMAEDFHCQEKAKAAKEESDQLESIARQRWPTVDAMHQEAADLAAFFYQPSSSEFIKATRRVSKATFPDAVNRHKRTLSLHAAQSDALTQELLIAAAKCVTELTEASRLIRRCSTLYSGERYEWTVGLDDYEAWKQARVTTDSAGHGA